MSAKAWIEKFIYNVRMAEIDGRPAPVTAPAFVKVWGETFKFLPDGTPVVMGKEVAKARWQMGARGAARLLNAGPALLGTVKQATNPARPLNEHYKVEALDAQHRMADLLNAARKLYHEIVPDEFRHKESLFFIWLKSFSRDEPDLLTNELYEKCGHVDRDLIRAFVRGEPGVTYLEKESERQDFLLRFMNGRLYKGDLPFDTSSMATAFKEGGGWAIYVVSPSGHWFAGPHKVGKFHHSSFMGGRSVLAAGEIKASSGAPVGLSAMSGHYRPSLQQFLAGLESLRKGGVSLAATKVHVYQGKSVVEVSATEFMGSAAVQARYSLFPVTPPAA